MSPAETADTSAVTLDWLLQIHSTVESARADKARRDG